MIAVIQGFSAHRFLESDGCLPDDDVGLGTVEEATAADVGNDQETVARR